MTLIKRILTFAALAALLLFPVWVYLNAQALSDWVALRDYTPSAPVKSLAAQDTMTNYATHIFYVNHPNLESDASQFRTDCGENEQTIVLGCYHSSQAGIFVYNVTEARLAGVQQVTAAHEMLHAAYDRLGSKDKSTINSQLMDYYNNHLTDQRVKDTIDAYRQTEPKDLVDEMHSIFGTEVAVLPAPLESYYAKYFTSRHAVTDFAAAYENEFTSREAQIKIYDAQLASLKSLIQTQENSLQAQTIKIDSDRNRLDSQKSNGQIVQYNAGVGSFNREVGVYNAGVERLRKDIASYNQIVQTRNAIASELASLDQAIDTRLTTQAAQ
jgi:hypothetical protein